MEPSLEWIAQLKQDNNMHGTVPLLPEIDLDCLAYVVYTSGTTGKPKGICFALESLSVQNLFTVILFLPVNFIMKCTNNRI